ncbi:MAG: FG-GAP repeat domain-containing protein [Candidatus Bathyarchaeia archaeon]
MEKKYPLAYSAVFLLCLSLTFSLNPVNAQPDDFTLKSETHWDTYGVGGTCIPGGNNMAIADFDGDDIPEVATGGFAYTEYNQSAFWAPFKIWNWDGTNLNLEANLTWTGSISCICAGDADGDGKTEILTTGPFRNDSGAFSSLRVWSWDGHDLTLKASYEGTPVGVVSVGDMDGDGKPEIVTTSTSLSFGDNQNRVAQLSIFRMVDGGLTKVASVDWDSANYARVSAVYAYDLNSDGKDEIISAGYANFLNNSHGQLRVWQFDGDTIDLKSNTEWYTVDGAYSPDVAGNVMGNTLANNVKAADVDGDGTPEIVTSGFTYNGNQAQGQLRIYNWTSDSLNLEASQEWTNLDITQPTSIAISDVNGDGKQEISVGGGTSGYGSWAPNAPGKSRAELKVFGYDGNTITLLQSKDWIFGDAAMAWIVDTSDLNRDGTMDIVTIGCIENGTLCDPDLRVWNLPSTVGSLGYLPLVAAGAGAAAVVAVAAAVLLLRKRR